MKVQSDIRPELRTAKEYFHALRLREAYAIYRRYFDRLPFHPEKEHAEVIGEFIRTLYELGRIPELKFYISELERWYAKTMDFRIAYQLAYIYVVTDPPSFIRATELLTMVLSCPDAKSFKLKAQLLLAYCADIKGDKKRAANIIEEAKESDDFFTNNILKVWRGKVARDAGNRGEAEEILRDLLKGIAFHSDWYAFGSAHIILASLDVEQGKVENARNALLHLRTLFQGKPHRSIERQMTALEHKIQEKSSQGQIQYRQQGKRISILLGDEAQELNSQIPSERLFAELLEKKFLDKPAIVKTLYQRDYRPSEDDSLIYYHIHALRKHLKRFGLAPNSIESVERGYRLLPEVRPVSG